ncbi:membrane-associated phospholipid phosphatase [Streptomyces sp. TE4109]
MRRETGSRTRTRTRSARPLSACAVLGVGAAAVVGLAPGGLGAAGAVEVTGGASASAYRSVTGAVADAPSWAGPLLEAATDGTLVVLGLLLAWVWWSAVRRGDTRVSAGTVLTGIGTVLAYAVSEAVKLVVDEERPCRALHGIAETAAECPPPGDWSFPSNHATLAVGLAVGLAVLRPRLAAVTLPVGAAAALLRVAVGAHYPHDVLAGAVLGASVVAAVLLAFLPLARRAASAIERRLRGRDDSGLVGDDGRGGPVVHAQPGQDGAHMRLDRPFHHVEPPGDLPVGQPAAEEGQYVAFPAGERTDPFPGGGAAAGQGARARRREVGDDPGRDLR